MVEVKWMNAGTAQIKTDAVNLFIGTECIALVRNEKSIAIVKSRLEEKGVIYRSVAPSYTETEPHVLCDDPLHDWEDFSSL